MTWMTGGYPHGLETSVWGDKLNILLVMGCFMIFHAFFMILVGVGDMLVMYGDVQNISVKPHGA